MIKLSKEEKFFKIKKSAIDRERAQASVNWNSSIKKVKDKKRK